MADDAKRLFDSLNEVADIKRLISARTHESYFLDFKRTNENQNRASYEEVAGRPISAFTHAEGGVIVWGVKCTKVKDVDYAESEEQIREVDKGVTYLDDVVPEVVNPPVPGIINKGIAYANGSGFIATYVPASDGSHSVTRTGTFHVRVGNQTRDLKLLTDIQALINRNKTPNLTLHYRLEGAGTSFLPDPYWNVRIKLFLVNNGRSEATAPYLVFSWTQKPQIFPTSRSEDHLYGLKKKTQNCGNFGPIELGAEANVVIHQDTEWHVIDSRTLEIRTDNTTYPDITIPHRIRATGFDSGDRTIIIPGMEMLETARKGPHPKA